MKTHFSKPAKPAIETCQACGGPIYPGQDVIVLGSSMETRRAIHLNINCFERYKREPEPVGIIQLMPVERWLEL